MGSSATVRSLKRTRRCAVAGEGAEDAEFDVPEVGQRLQLGQVGGRDGQHHALLGLGEPDLPGREAGILERRVGQLHLDAQLLAHLAHGGGEAAGAAVGDGGVEAPVARQLDQLDQPLLGDRVADLDGAAGGLARLVRQLGRGEGGAVDAVAAGAPAEHDHQVADLGGARVLADGQQADAAAEDERVAQVALVIEHGAVDGGHAQLVAVVADARHHALGNALRVEDAVGQRGRRGSPAGQSRARRCWRWGGPRRR